MENLESEFTITIPTDGEGFVAASTFFAEKYANDMFHETVIRYNSRSEDPVTTLKRGCNKRKHHYRVVMRDRKPISPVDMKNFVIPEQAPSSATAASTVIAYQEKETLDHISEIVPFTIETQKTIFVRCTWKYSKENNMSAADFHSTVLANVNDTDKSFVPSFGQQRVSVYNIHPMNIRFCIGKCFDFGGTQEGRRPTHDYYYLEFEREHIDLRVNFYSSAMRQFVNRTLAALPAAVLETVFKHMSIATYSNHLCRLSQEDYIRQFTYEFEKFLSTTYRAEGALQNVYLAPKWNGVRGIGVWSNNNLLVKTPRSLRSFTLPSYCLQPLVVQIELLHDNITNDRCIITEIMGTFLYQKERLSEYYKTKYIPTNFVSDKSNNFIVRINPIYSMELIAKFHLENPAFFTYYRKLRCVNTLRALFYASDGIPCQITLPPHCDGILAICVYNEGRDSLYAKLKSYHTIELVYDINKKTLCSANEDMDFLSHPHDVRIENFDVNKVMWYNTCLDAKYIIVEFEIHRSSYTTIDDTDIVSLLKHVTLYFKNVRYDKFTADTNSKIRSILYNVVITQHTSNKDHE